MITQINHIYCASLLRPLRQKIDVRKGLIECTLSR